jgi:hypothetical protein
MLSEKHQVDNITDRSSASFRFATAIAIKALADSTGSKSIPTKFVIFLKHSFSSIHDALGILTRHSCQTGQKSSRALYFYYMLIW